MRVLGVDPGLTRCGLGVVDGDPGRPLHMVASDTSVRLADDDIAQRLLALEATIDAWVELPSPGCRRRRAGLRPAQRAHRHGHGAGLRGRDPRGGASRHARRPAHPQRGQGGGHRQRARRQGPGHRDGDPAAAAHRRAAPGGRGRRAGAGDLPRLARRCPGPASPAGRCLAQGRSDDRVRRRPGGRDWRPSGRRRGRRRRARRAVHARHAGHPADRAAGRSSRPRSSSARTR